MSHGFPLKWTFCFWHMEFILLSLLFFDSFLFFLCTYSWCTICAFLQSKRGEKSCEERLKVWNHRKSISFVWKRTYDTMNTPENTFFREWACHKQSMFIFFLRIYPTPDTSFPICKLINKLTHSHTREKSKNESQHVLSYIWKFLSWEFKLCTCPYVRVRTWFKYMSFVKENVSVSYHFH